MLSSILRQSVAKGDAILYLVVKYKLVILKIKVTF